MANPQQPELRRSAKVPALDPDASESKLSAQDRPTPGGNVGDVPEDQRPGHHPDHDQDKPDLDAFAERLGVVAEGDEPDDAPVVEAASPAREPAPSSDLADETADDTASPTPPPRTKWQSQWRRVLAPAMTAVGITIIVIRRIRR